MSKKNDHLIVALIVAIFSGLFLIVKWIFKLINSTAKKPNSPRGAANYIYGRRESMDISGSSLKRKIFEDERNAIESARDILENKEEYVILDTETTGLGDNDVIVQIGIIDLDGNVLFDEFIKPTKRKRISYEATRIHGITMQMLEDKPYFKNVFDQFKNVIKGKKVLIYNARYDIRLLSQTMKQDEMPQEFNAQILCLMDLYSEFVGQWSDYHGNYTWQRLQGGDHTAIGDCKAALDVINEMANSQPTPL